MTFADLQKVLSAAAKRALEAHAASEKKILELLQSGAIAGNDDLALLDNPELAEKVNALAALTDLWLEYHNHIRFLIFQNPLMDDTDQGNTEVFVVQTAASQQTKEIQS